MSQGLITMSDQKPPIPHAYLFLVLLGAGAAACSGDDITVPPTTGSVEVTTSTAGPELDPDGYSVQIDAAPSQAIEVTGSVSQTDLEPGNHTVQLAGLAPNCTVAGENPRSVSVTAGETATVAFSVTCGPTSGGLQVSSTTSGSSPDPDGYTITVDGSDRGTLAVTGSVTIDGVAAGVHLVGLSGVAANCQIEGENPRMVTVTAGASAGAAFTVTCAAPPANPGTLRIRTTTTGADPDPNGYAFAVDGGTTQPIGVNSAVSIANLPAGQHSVRLSDVASSCTVSGDNPRSVTLSAGSTAEVSFAITCRATTGSIRVSVTTSGSATDPDGYTVKVDGGPGQPISVTGEITIAGVAAGSHAVEFSDLAANCKVEGENPRSTTVAAGQEAAATFAVTCQAPSSGLGSWAEIGVIPTYRWTMARAVVQNASGHSLFFTIGGGDPERNSAMTRVEAYDATTGAWTQTRDMPAPRTGATADVVDGKIYLIGGLNEHGDPTNTVYRYHPTADSWTERASLPINSVFGISGVIAGKLYLLTAPTSIGSAQQLFSYDEATDSWTRLADPPNQHVSGIGGAINGKLYVAWGHSWQGPFATQTVDVYDPATDRWTTALTATYGHSECLETMDCSVHGASSTVLNGELYVIGGLNDDNAMSRVMAYNPGTNSWIAKASMNHRREAVPIAGTVRNAAGEPRIVVTGGRDSEGSEIVPEVEVYTP